MMAFRVLVPNVADCYRALGSIHAAYPNVMGRFETMFDTSPSVINHCILVLSVPKNTRLKFKFVHLRCILSLVWWAHWNYNDPGSENIGKFKWIQS